MSEIESGTFILCRTVTLDADWARQDTRLRLVSCRPSLHLELPSDTGWTCQILYNSFKSKVQSLINSHIPIKMTSSRTNMPWFNNTLKRMCKKKQRLFNKAKRSGSNKCWQQYRTFKRDTLKAIRRQRWKHINNVLQVGLEQSDPKPFWRYVRAQRQDFSGVSPLLQKGKLITDRLKQTNILNNQFASVFTKENILDIPTLHGPDFPDLPELSISQDGVEKLLNGIKVSKASGPDLIPCRFLRELAHEIAPILTIIY